MRLIDLDDVNALITRMRNREENSTIKAKLDELTQTLECFQAIVTEPKDPLTIEELRKMDGEPVWVTFLEEDDRGNPIALWAIVQIDEDGDVCYCFADGIHHKRIKCDALWLHVKAAYKKQVREGMYTSNKFSDDIRNLSDEKLAKLLENIQRDAPDGWSYCSPTIFPEERSEWIRLLRSHSDKEWLDEMINYYGY